MVSNGAITKDNGTAFWASGKDVSNKVRLMSYTRPQLKTYLNRHYRPGTYFILYTGTSGKQTEAEEAISGFAAIGAANIASF